MTSDVEPKQRWWRIAAMAVAGGLVGFFASQAAIDVTRDAALSWADYLALLLAVTLTGQGLFVFLLSLSRRAAGSAFGGPGAKPASDAQLSFYREQGGVLLLAGAMLAGPVMLVLFSGEPPARDLAIATMAGIVVAFAAQTVLNIIVWRRADEFMRRLLVETSSVCFWVLQAALFLWAAGERLALLPGLDAWSAVTIMMSVYLIASAFITVRNGAAA